MNQTPTELLAPYKAPLIEHGRALLRAAGTDCIAFEIPGVVVSCTMVVGATDCVARLMRSDSREPMLGGRRAGDPPAPQLAFDEPDASTDGPAVVDSSHLVTILRWLRAAADSGKPVHSYKYLDLRAAEGAPAKANKEIALLSAVLEFGRRKGELETNPLPRHQVQQDPAGLSLRHAGRARPGDAHGARARRNVLGRRAVPARGILDP
ncbi:hypothetical protein IM543_07090 [Massilia sp. UMI-21]|nr:hypothetical protein IM543_07090 [Massilia sp. UMI-21]